MKLISIRTQILEVSDRWKSQYQTNKSDIYKKLKALDKSKATAKDVEKIIGNTSWACPTTCDECGKAYNIVVEVGDEPGYESNTAEICLKCLKKAIKLIEKEKIRFNENKDNNETDKSKLDTAKEAEKKAVDKTK